jgi:hypothetical protein
MIYVAAPYNHPDGEVIHERMEAVYDLIADLMNEGQHATTPLFMHEVCVRKYLPQSFSFWQSYCFDILKRCDTMVVLKLKDWDLSVGVQAEIIFCEENNIQILYREPK